MITIYEGARGARTSLAAAYTKSGSYFVQLPRTPCRAITVQHTAEYSAGVVPEQNTILYNPCGTAVPAGRPLPHSAPRPALLRFLPAVLGASKVTQFRTLTLGRALQKKSDATNFFFSAKKLTNCIKLQSVA